MPRTNYRISLLIIPLIIIDQLVKYINLKYYPSAVSINKGVVFGFINNIYLVIILTFIGIVVLYYLFKNNNKNNIFPIVLILAGAISNIIDRFVYGGVIDYINLFNYSQLNIADIYIFIGVAVYLYWLIKNPAQKPIKK